MADEKGQEKRIDREFPSLVQRNSIRKNLKEFASQDTNTVVKHLCISDSRARARSLIQLLTMQVSMSHFSISSFSV